MIDPMKQLTTYIPNYLKPYSSQREKVQEYLNQIIIHGDGISQVRPIKAQNVDRPNFYRITLKNGDTIDLDNYENNMEFNYTGHSYNGIVCAGINENINWENDEYIENDDPCWIFTQNNHQTELNEYNYGFVCSS